MPDKQEPFFGRRLGHKDEVNYDARSTTLEEARRLLAELDAFAGGPRACSDRRRWRRASSMPWLALRSVSVGRCRRRFSAPAAG
ncbi:MAG TPA: hypothetical protein PKC97_18300 [Burkholderiaceae bacterium]|jgi:hypothetical protein|nr:hypothetical protein [Burkholderiaceae bacterium]